jgi:hypothetical protein
MAMDMPQNEAYEHRNFLYGQVSETGLERSNRNWYATSMTALDWLSFCGLCANVLGVFLVIGATVWEELFAEIGA